MKSFIVSHLYQVDQVVCLFSCVNSQVCTYRFNDPVCVNGKKLVYDNLIVMPVMLLLERQ